MLPYKMPIEPRLAGNMDLSIGLWQVKYRAGLSGHFLYRQVGWLTLSNVHTLH